MILISLLYLLLFTQPAHADVVLPTTTTVQFQNGGEPVTSSVGFTVSCYGYSYIPGPDPNYTPGSYVETVVFSISNTCATYGCTINDPYYLNYRHIDFCAVTGTVDGKDFTIRNIGNKPYGSCTSAKKTNNEICTSTFDIKDAFYVTKTNGVALNQTPFIKTFWLALLATIVIEIIMLVVCVKMLFRKIGKDLAWYNIILVGAILSTATLPYVWFVIPNIFVGEIFAVLFETLLLKKLTKLSWLAAGITSFICNVASYYLGWLLVGWF